MMSSSSPVLKSPSKSMSPSSDCADLNRVHEELEKLNIATDVINKLELQLDEARAAFREIQSGWSQKLEQLAKKLGGCIEKSRPYYEARLKVLEAQQEAQRAALRFERANSMHAVAKQQVALTQEGLDRQGSKNIDPACLEVLNHHIQRVNDAECERLQSEEEHKAISRAVGEANARVSYLEKELKRSIVKSKSYFDARVEFTKVLEKQKELIQRLELEIKQKKSDYNTSLRNLEKISEQIHEQRQLGRRDPGVGSETPGPPMKCAEKQNQRKSSEERKMSLSVGAREVAEELRRKNSKTKSPLNEILTEVEASEKDGETGRTRAISAPVEIDAPQNASKAPRYSSGVILLASELSAYEFLKNNEKAFLFPPEDFDLQYKTVPEGVKPFPTPPETPNSSSGKLTLAGDFNRSTSSHTNSDASSLASFSIEDENIEHIMKQPEKLIDEIERIARRSVDDLPERSSGSGAEDFA